MSHSSALEGTGAEPAHHLEAHPQERFRLMPLPETEKQETAQVMREPNWKALEVLRIIKQRQKDRPSIDGSDSLKFLHEARDGGES